LVPISILKKKKIQKILDYQSRCSLIELRTKTKINQKSKSANIGVDGEKKKKERTRKTFIETLETGLSLKLSYLESIGYCKRCIMASSTFQCGMII